MPRHVLLALALLAACKGEDGPGELDCANEADDDDDGDIDCADADCSGTLACASDDTDGDTDDGGDTDDTDVEDAPDLMSDAAASQLTGETAGDRAGFAIGGGGDVTGDGKNDLVVGAYLWKDDGGSENGQVYVVSGAPTGDISLAAADARIPGVDDEGEFGHSVDIVGDVTGDGQDDLLVGARRAFTTRGLGYLIPGPLTGDVDLEAVAFELRGEEDEDSAGWSVSRAGDVDGDGVLDLLIGADRNDDPGVDAGRAYLILGPVTDDIALGSITSTQGARFNGAEADDRAGRCVSGAGDVDGDGLDDILIGAFHADGTGASDVDRGAAYLVYQPTLGVVELEDGADIGRFYGKRDYAAAGDTLTGAGDTNGDGYDDFAVGAVGASEGGTESGAVYVWTGSATRYEASVDLDDGAASLVGSNAYDRAGFAVDGPGDLDGDGNADLIVGAFGYDNLESERGAAYVVLGPFAGESEVGVIAAQAIMGVQGGDQVGHRVGGVGDVSGDGDIDLLIGSYAWSSETGAAWLVLGGGW